MPNLYCLTANRVEVLEIVTTCWSCSQKNEQHGWCWYWTSANLSDSIVIESVFFEPGFCSEEILDQAAEAHNALLPHKFAQISEGFRSKTKLIYDCGLETSLTIQKWM